MVSFKLSIFVHFKKSNCTTTDTPCNVIFCSVCLAQYCGAQFFPLCSRMTSFFLYVYHGQFPFCSFALCLTIHNNPSITVGCQMVVVYNKSNLVIPNLQHQVTKYKSYPLFFRGKC